MLQYKLDAKSRDILGNELRDKVLELKPFSYNYVLDIGGNNGKLVKALKTKTNKVISIDIDRNIMFGADGKPLTGIELVQGNVLYLPFKNDTFDVIFARAVLHHVPNELEDSFIEIKRILKKDGLLLIEEPGFHNPVAYIFRKAFPTSSHEEDEEPLKINILKQLSYKHFNVKEIKYFWLLSYTLPHLISRLPKKVKQVTRNLLKLIVKFDKYLLQFTLFKPFCGYIMILCQKEG